jgi:hypothetical protein
MMKITKYLPIMISVLLAGCTPNSETPSFQMVVSYVEEGGLIDTDGFFINEQVLVEKTNIIFLIGIEECATCVTAKSDIQQYAFYNHMNVYYVDINGISSDEYSALRLATVEYGEAVKALPALIENSSTIAFPMMYIFYQGVGLAFAQDSFTVTIDRYVNVLPPNE